MREKTTWLPGFCKQQNRKWCSAQERIHGSPIAWAVRQTRRNSHCRPRRSGRQYLSQRSIKLEKLFAEKKWVRSRILDAGQPASGSSRCFSPHSADRAAGASALRVSGESPRCRYSAPALFLVDQPGRTRRGHVLPAALPCRRSRFTSRSHRGPTRRLSFPLLLNGPA